MLKPATPLSVVLFIAFALLLLATLSTPIIKGIPLATYHGVNYGVLGYCSGNTCSGIGLGYRNEPNFDDSNFSLPASTRLSLSSILIVHPIACLFTLICLILTLASHARGPGHSSRYLLGLIIFLLPTLLLSLLSFLIDILLFAPHQSWGTWLVLAATVLIAVSDGLTCCMRRTLVSRKDQRKRIEENAEMNGENYYNREAAIAVAPPPITNTTTGNAGGNNLPSFATFEKSSGVAAEEDRIPLNDRSATTYSNSTTVRPSMDDSSTDRYAMGVGRGGPNMRGGGRGGRPYNGPRDEFGNPIGSSPALGGRRSSQDSYMRNMSPGPMGGRGRGGYPPRGMPRGGPYNGRGGPIGRGGMGPGGPMAAGVIAGEGMGRRGPPPGYGPPGRGGYGPPGALQRRQSPGPPSAPGYNGRQPSPGPVSNAYSQEIGLARAESPPPLPDTLDDPATIGQAIEMDERTGSPAQTPTFNTFPQSHPLRDSDSDLQGMVGLQRGQMPPMDPSANYSQEYVPARTNWGTSPPPSQSPHASSSPPPQIAPTSRSASNPRRTSEPYYEDVDPRFSQDHSKGIPHLLVPGAQPRNGDYDQRQNHPGIQPSASYDSIQDGPLSESSNFTSISERGINPQWQSEQQRHQYATGGVPNRQPQQQVAQQRDFLLTSNPDFELGAIRGAPSNRGRGGGPMPAGGMM